MSSLAGGGAERVIVDMARYLVEKGRDVTILTLNGNEPASYRVPDGVGREQMDIRRPSKSLWQSLRHTFSHLRAIRQRVTDIAPDVVVSFVDQTNVRVIASLLGTGIPVVVSERTDPRMHRLAPTWRIARRLSYPFATNLVVQTESVRLGVKGWAAPSRIIAIPNAVRASGPPGDEPATGLPHTENQVMAVGRLEWVKGHRLLLDAFHRADLATKGWRLTILGEGSERGNLTRQAEELQIDSVVDLMGHVHNVAARLLEADIFVLPSRYEGFPNALLEAMQLGRASISFDCRSGPADIIEHGLNGLLVPANDVGQLSSALIRLAADPQLRKRLGTEATKVRERFAPERIYGRWLGLLDAAVLDDGSAM